MNWTIVNKPLTARFDLFHIKWIVQDKQSDYDNLAPEQYINHFQNNKEITSKSFLKKNLENYFDGELQLYDYFPRSYDFSFPQATKSFVNDYLTNTIFCILKKTLLYCEVKFQDQWGLVENEKYQLERAIQEEQKMKDRLYFENMKPTPKLVSAS